jgi:hypothetical protein
MSRILITVSFVSALLFGSVSAISQESTEQVRWLLPKEQKYIKISEQCLFVAVRKAKGEALGTPFNCDKAVVDAVIEDLSGNAGKK